MPILSDPSFRDVASPLTKSMLSALDPRCRVVQFNSALSDADYTILADWLIDYPQVTLRAYGGYDRPITDLEFLRFFPRLRAFQADALERQLTNIDGLGYLPTDTKRLGLGQTHKRLSLAPLQRFRGLQRLFLEGHTNDIEVIGNLGNLTSLTLRSTTLPDLTILLPLRKLLALDLKLGGTRKLDLLPQVGKLQYLELWMVRGLDDISVVGEVETLEHLFLQALGRVTALPSFAACNKLTHIHLETLKGLADLSPLLTAHALSDLALIDMRHLHPADVAVLRAHPALQRLFVALGSVRKNDEVERILPLPRADTFYRHPALDPRST